MALHVHNEMVMKKTCEGENKSGERDCRWWNEEWSRVYL